MRFATLTEHLGASAIESCMSLIAFLPILYGLSKNITTIPIFGRVPHALVWFTLLWALLGTVVLAGAGRRLPGLEFQNQLAEAALRKVVVQPPCVL